MVESKKITTTTASSIPKGRRLLTILTKLILKGNEQDIDIKKI